MSNQASQANLYAVTGQKIGVQVGRPALSICIHSLEQVTAASSSTGAGEGGRVDTRQEGGRPGPGGGQDCGAGTRHILPLFQGQIC